MSKPKIILTTILLAGAFSLASAQSAKSSLQWEEAQARKITPEIRMVVTPQICDMTMLSGSREKFGPYSFPIKSIDGTTNADLDNFKSNALYLACREMDADAVIEVIYHSYINEKDNKSLVIELSGYPVKYSNFRPATKAEVEMMGVAYPRANSSVMITPDAAPVLNK